MVASLLLDGLIRADCEKFTFGGRALKPPLGRCGGQKEGRRRGEGGEPIFRSRIAFYFLNDSGKSGIRA